MATTTSKSDKENTSTRDLEEDIRQLREDMAQLTEHIRKTGEDSAGAARHAASEGVEQMRQQGEAAAKGLKSDAQDIGHELTETMRERPITSLAVAAGVGYLLAMMMRR